MKATFVYQLHHLPLIYAPFKVSTVFHKQTSPDLIEIDTQPHQSSKEKRFHGVRLRRHYQPMRSPLSGRLGGACGIGLKGNRLSLASVSPGAHYVGLSYLRYFVHYQFP